MKRLLEVIACSVDDAVAAEAGGAGRLEVVRELRRGGLTPSIEMVRTILERVSIPVRAMIRESDGFGVADRAEAGRLCAAVCAFASLPIDGIVLGFAAAEAVDTAVCAELLGRAPALKATFHHAFDAAPDWSDALTRIKSVANFDRVLTSAPHASWNDLVEAARPELTILAGGGMTEERIRSLARETHVTEFHAGRAAREPQTSDGRVSVERVQELVAALA
jgi:copper homeostasis protein